MTQRLVLQALLGAAFIIVLILDLNFFFRDESARFRPLEEAWLEAPIQQGDDRACDQMRAIAEESSRECLERLALSLFSQTAPLPALPYSTFRSPDSLEREIQEGHSRLFSNEMARDFATLANRAGLPTRLLRAESSFEGEKRVTLLAESYIAEQGSWACVNLKYRRLFVETEGGHLLSGPELIRALKEGDAGQLQVALFEGGRIINRPYGESAALDQTILTAGPAALIYPQTLNPPLSFWERVTLLSHPHPIFTLARSHYNLIHWIKIGLFFLTAILPLCLTWMIFYSGHKQRRVGDGRDSRIRMGSI